MVTLCLRLPMDGFWPLELPVKYQYFSRLTGRFTLNSGRWHGRDVNDR